MPKCHKYHGTAVSVRIKVPIKNELVVQLIRSVGIRKIKEREKRQINARVARISKLLKGATENHVFLGPGMNAAAMCASKLLRFHFGRRPELLFHCSSGISQLGRGRTTHEQALETGTDLWFWSAGWIKKKSRCHIKIKVDKRSALWRYRRETSPSLLDLRSLGE